MSDIARILRENFIPSPTHDGKILLPGPLILVLGLIFGFLIGRLVQLP